MPSLFEHFCNHVDSTIFAKENMGEMVAFIIDQAFIDDFCKKHSVSEKILMREVMHYIYRPASYGHLHVKGILAIQLYAATKREDSGGITEKNYRDRLSLVLDWDINDLQSWMSENQEEYWEKLYRWCHANDFDIAKCKPKTGAGRYVQYPVQQAARVFTQKDLKYIAYHFVNHGLQPDEDLKESDFWRILSKRSISSYVHTNHGKRLIENPEFLTDAYRQIFNYYLRWDGSYIDINRSRSIDANKEKFFLYLSEDGYLDVRDKDLKKKLRLEWKDLKENSLSGLYSFKRERLIIFKRSEDYDGYWEETRYLEGREEGIAFVFQGNASQYNRSLYTPSYFYNKNPIFSNNRIKIYKFGYSINFSQFYTEKKFFSLEGGLKIGRMCFMEGGAPLLIMEKDSKFWIDGEESPIKPVNGVLPLNFLKAGDHDIKFPNFKKIEFSIKKVQRETREWDDSYNKWFIDKDNVWWETAANENGIVGIDYSCIKIEDLDTSDIGILTRWAKFHLTGRAESGERNIAIRILTKK